MVSIALGLSLAQAAGAQSAPQVSPGAAQPLPPAAPPASRPIDESLLTVPAVVDRPLGLDEGPKIRVTNFKLTGASDHPHEGLSVIGFLGILDEAVRAQPADGYTVNQLQAIAGRITLAYRAKGYVLAQAFVPAQDVQNGVVAVQVLEGKLGFVRVEGNKRYRNSTLEAPFTAVRGQAVSQADVEARLLRLSDYPGLSVFGVFTPGRNVGESDLVLKVQKERPVEFQLGADNFGNRFDGEYRGRAGFAWNDPLGIGDRLQVSFLKARSSGSDQSGADTKYWSGDYRLPFAAGRAAGTLAYSNNDYAAGGALNGLIAGRSKVAEVGVEVETTRSRLGRSYVFLKGSSKKGEFSQPTGAQHETLKGGELGFAFDHTDRSVKGRWAGSVSIAHGTNSDHGLQTIRASSDDSYTLSHFQLERIQHLSTFQNLRLKVSGQLTSNALPTVEQASFGGPSSVRAYEVAHYVGDKLVAGTIEYYLGAPGFARKLGPGGRPWGQTLQVVAFLDAGKSWLNKPSTGELAELEDKAAGLGLVFSLPDRMYIRIDGAKALSPSAAEKANPGYKSTRVYASFGVMF